MNQLARWLVVCIALAAALAIGYVIVSAMGIVVPHFVVVVLWITLAAVIGIAAIKLVMGMPNQP